MSIQAIETEYKGYKFRSRLEARWAVFFDEMEIEWEYEPEGFENENGNRYLPDFYLPQFDMWCEVKPNDQSRTAEINMAISFIGKTSPIRAILILPNIPAENKTTSIFWYKCLYWDNFLNSVAWVDTTIFALSCVDKKVRWMVDEYIYHHKGGRYTLAREFNVPWDAVPDKNGVKDSTLAFAYKKARQARFEHGDTP